MGDWWGEGNGAAAAANPLIAVGAWRTAGFAVFSGGDGVWKLVARGLLV